jgi:Fur family ferric uptake transcriptional regulator
MTAVPNSPPQVFSDVEDAVSSLRASGLRLSTPRRLVLEALFAAEGPVAAGHLARTLSLEESSVYRNLELLERRGVVRHVHLGHSPGLYVLVGADHGTEYLYCEACAKVTAVDPGQLDPIREQIRREFGHTPTFSHFAIVGVCEACAHADTHGAGSHAHSHGDYVHTHPRSSPPSP